MIRVLQFAGIINRYDFIDVIVQRADPGKFHIGVCVGSNESNIAQPVYNENTPRWVIPWKGRSNLHVAAWRLARILREWKADILHTHHYDEAIIGLLATRLHPGTRLIIGRHYSDSIYRSSKGLKRKILLAAENVVNGAANRIVVPSTYIYNILTQWQHVNPIKIDRVPYGFVAEKYALPQACDVIRIREELGLKGRFVVGTFSRLHEEKGHRYLVQAMSELRSRLPQATLLVVGEGSERGALERQIHGLALTNAVQLLGWRRDAMTIMSVVDIVVQPTLQEAFSQVMAEALWMGKPLVITDVSGATDIIRDGQNGILVPKAESSSLVSAIERLANDPELRERIGLAGKAYVMNHLDIDKIIPKYEQTYLWAMTK